LNETSADEDVLAADCDIVFREANVRVQVKCTSKFTIGGASASWPVESAWLRKWEESALPIYFVLVIVPRNLPTWIDHNASGTMHRTAAFWRRLKADEIGKTVSVPKTQRLTRSTLDQWHLDMLRTFTPGESP
jgi:hypothetical protein